MKYIFLNLLSKIDNDTIFKNASNDLTFWQIDGISKTNAGEKCIWINFEQNIGLLNFGTFQSSWILFYKILNLRLYWIET